MVDMTAVLATSWMSRSRRTLRERSWPGGSSEMRMQPLLRDRPLMGDSETAYVCRGFVCDAPVTSVTELAALVRARTTTA